MKAILELAWIRGQLVVMGRNQTVKMLIEDPPPRWPIRLLGLRFRPGTTSREAKSVPSDSAITSRQVSQ